MTIVLKNQVEACERSAEELDAQLASARAPQNHAFLAAEIQSLLKALVSLTKDTFDQVELTRAEGNGPNGAVEIGREQYRQFARLDRLFARCERILSKATPAAELQARDQFYLAWRKIQNITAFDFERVIAADGQLQRGQGRDLGEVMNELRHRA